MLSDCFRCTAVVEIGEENTVSVGPWSIFAKVIQVDDEDISNSLLAQKACNDMDDLMKGTISYYLKIPKSASSSPLQIAGHLTKSNRPPAWKNTDSKVQDTLPLVSCTPEALRLLSEDKSFDNSAFVRVELALLSADEVRMANAWSEA